MLPTEDDYRHALQIYRERWPTDGYFDQNERFIATYTLLRRFYSTGLIVDVGGWPGDFSCTLASLGLTVGLLDKDLTRPTNKVFDPQTRSWVMGSAGTLAEKCSLYGVETIECDIEREKTPVNDGAFDCIIFPAW